MEATLDSDIDLWLCALRAAGRSPVTVAGHWHTWGHFLDWLDRPATDCTRRDALAYVERLRQTNKPWSVAHHVRGLRAGYSWLIQEELLTGANPFANLRLSVPQTVQSTPTVEEVDAMLAAARQDRRACAILTVLADTGCRRGELAAITRDDVDVTSGVLRLPVSKTRARVVPLNDRAVVALGRWMRHRHCVPALRAHPSLWSLDDPAQLIPRQADYRAFDASTPPGC
jgi:integrase